MARDRDVESQRLAVQVGLFIDAPDFEFLEIGIATPDPAVMLDPVIVDSDLRLFRRSGSWRESHSIFT
jgi:hypothetical protein